MKIWLPDQHRYSSDWIHINEFRIPKVGEYVQTYFIKQNEECPMLITDNDDPYLNIPAWILRAQ